MSGADRKEHFRMMDEIVHVECATPPSPGTYARGVSAPIAMMTECVSVGSVPPVSQERIGELQTLDTLALVKLVHTSRAAISKGELLAIHSIATDRVKDGGRETNEAIRLLQETMFAALSKSA